MRMIASGRRGSGFANALEHILDKADIKLPGNIGSSDAGDTWVQDYWETGAADLYGDMQNNPFLNSGQQTILSTEQDNVLGYLSQTGEGYDPDEFIGFLQNELEDKYDALSETWNEYSGALEDLWDHSSGGDGIGSKKFMGRTF